MEKLCPRRLSYSQFGVLMIIPDDYTRTAWGSSLTLYPNCLVAVQLYIAAASLQCSSYCMQQWRLPVQPNLCWTQHSTVQCCTVLLLLMSSVCCDSASLGCHQTFKLQDFSIHPKLRTFKFFLCHPSVSWDSRVSSCALASFPVKTFDKRKSARFWDSRKLL